MSRANLSLNQSFTELNDIIPDTLIIIIHHTSIVCVCRREIWENIQLECDNIGPTVYIILSCYHLVTDYAYMYHVMSL